MKWIDQFSLEKQVAIVTGAAGGLGSELVKILMEAGADVVLADSDEIRLNGLAQELDPSGQRLLAQKCDVTKERDILSLIDRAHQKFGKIDILVNSAGVLGPDAAWSNVFPLTHSVTREEDAMAEPQP